MEVVLELGSRLILQAGLTDNISSANDLLISHIENGTADAKFREMISCQGGDIEKCLSKGWHVTGIDILDLDDDSKVRDFTALHKYLFEEVDNYAKGHIASVILILAESQTSTAIPLSKASVRSMKSW